MYVHFKVSLSVTLIDSPSFALEVRRIDVNLTLDYSVTISNIDLVHANLEIIHKRHIHTPMYIYVYII